MRGCEAAADYPAFHKDRLRRMVHTRSSTKEEAKSEFCQLPIIKRRRRSSAAATSSGVAPQTPATKQEKRRYRCSACTTAGSRCRFKALEKGGLCGVHSLPSKLVDEKCPICLECFTDRKSVVRKECGHHFHKACIQEWLKGHHTCPVCRHQLVEKQEPTMPEGINPFHLLLLPLMSSYFNMSPLAPPGMSGEHRILGSSVTGDPNTIQLHIFYSN